MGLRPRSFQNGLVDVRKIEAQCRFEMAQQLVGREVTWANDPAGPRMRVEAATFDGLVRVSGYSGNFAPHLFSEVSAVSVKEA